MKRPIRVYHMRVPADPVTAKAEIFEGTNPQRWLVIHSLTTLVAGVLSLMTAHLWPLGAGALFSLLHFPRHGYRGVTLGPANSVTLLRLGLLGVFIAFFRHAPGAVVAGLVLANLALDGFDGFLARRTQSESAFGAFFDTETDGLWTLAVCVALFNGAFAPLWILVPGLLRYLKLLSFALLPPRSVAPRSWVGRFAFGFFMLGCAAGFAFPASIGPALVVLGAFGVVTSFGREIGLSYLGSRGAR